MHRVPDDSPPTFSVPPGHPLELLARSFITPYSGDLDVGNLSRGSGSCGMIYSAWSPGCILDRDHLSNICVSVSGPKNALRGWETDAAIRYGLRLVEMNLSIQRRWLRADQLWLRRIANDAVHYDPNNDSCTHSEDPPVPIQQQPDGVVVEQCNSVGFPVQNSPSPRCALDSGHPTSLCAAPDSVWKNWVNWYPANSYRAHPDYPDAPSERTLARDVLVESMLHNTQKVRQLISEGVPPDWARMHIDRSA